jgi:NitT/TauT family transport system permease protein
MSSNKKMTYSKNEATSWPVPNYWDFIALTSIIGLLFLLGWAAGSMFSPFHLGQQIHISLDPKMLPYYALRTVLRMFIALAVSLIFTFVIGAWAAKSRLAERFIIPAIDIGQSIPPLGFLTIIVVALINLAPNSMIGPECAAIFCIFTAQVWNMTLSFYQSLRTIPTDLCEAAQIFRLSGWQKFWRIEVPYAMPGLLWNTMMSMSGSWVFLVASEAITVANQNISLPGIGSYIAQATLHKSITADVYALITMLIVIVLYDQIIFRPLVAWSEKFKTTDSTADIEPQSWLLNLWQRTQILQYFAAAFGALADAFVNFRLFQKMTMHNYEPNIVAGKIMRILSVLMIWVLIVALSYYGLHSIFEKVSLGAIAHTFTLGFYTALRVSILIFISMLIWVPIGVWIGLRPRATQIVQPIAQFFAAFPINLVFPFAVYAIVHYKLNINIWCSPLMIMGTQWYILFNVIAGASAIPKQYHIAVGAFKVKKSLWWRKFMLPAIAPYLITGAITAAGGAWNISIIAEALSWGKQTLYAKGLGAYITETAVRGDYIHLSLGIITMCVYVVVINRLFWQPLYNKVSERYQIT